MKVLGTVFWLMMFSLLQGCISISIPPGDDHRIGIPIGTTVIVKEPLDIKGNTRRIFIQNCTYIDRPESFEPYCYFKIDSKFSPDTLKTGTFKVVKLEQKKNWVGAASYRVASVLGDTFFLDWVAHLESELQPGISALICGVYDDAIPQHYLTPNDIRRNLGNVVMLQFP